MKFKSITRNGVITENTTILADGFGSISLMNLGTAVVTIDDNIPLNAGSQFAYDNHPLVKIGQNISIRFANEGTKKLLFIKTYNEAL